ncbi:MAG: hypothetical protein Q9227_009527 [Pyrenula ochraceoflavens]
MSDLKPILSSILSQTYSTALPDEHILSPKRIDSFLEEALNINASITSLLHNLRRFRQPYLSDVPPPRHQPPKSLSSSSTIQPQPTIHFTPTDRATFDTTTSTQLRSFNTLLQRFSSIETTRQDALRLNLERKYGKPTGALWRWAAGSEPVSSAPKSPEQDAEEGRAHALKTVRESILWYLGRNLQSAGAMYGEMVEIRVNREKEREKSILWKMDGPGKATNMNRAASTIAPEKTYMNGSTGPEPTPASRAAITEEESAQIEAQLTPAQLQLFAQENNSLLRHYEDTLSKVQAAEKSLIEISDLQGTLVSHLTEQGEMIERLVEDAEGTGENVQRGNRELKRAAERSSTARMVFWATVGICSSLVVWDLIF